MTDYLTMEARLRTMEKEVAGAQRRAQNAKNLIAVVERRERDVSAENQRLKQQLNRAHARLRSLGEDLDLL